MLLQNCTHFSLLCFIIVARLHHDPFYHEPQQVHSLASERLNAVEGVLSQFVEKEILAELIKNRLILPE